MSRHAPREPIFEILVAVSLGIFISLFVIASITALGHGDYISWVKDKLYAWQTFATGVIALLIALATVGAVERQIETSKQQEEERRERRLFAVRASLPQALADITGYCDACIHALMRLRSYSSEEVVEQPHDKIPTPVIPASAMETIYACIEQADTHSRDVLAKFAEDVQVQRSRVADALESPHRSSSSFVFVFNIDEFILDSLELHQRANLMFDYARRRSDSISYILYREDMWSGAFAYDLHAEDYPTLHKLLELRYPSRRDSERAEAEHQNGCH